MTPDDKRRLAALRARYRGLQGDMPPFGDVITLLRLLDEATAEKDAATAALREIPAQRWCPPDVVEYGRRNNLPEFAAATWDAGFIDGWRAAQRAVDAAHSAATKSTEVGMLYFPFPRARG